ncbi:nucleotide disphospho-sugar-binding domain-containing protein [Streptomyces adustus]
MGGGLRGAGRRAPRWIGQHLRRGGARYPRCRNAGRPRPAAPARRLEAAGAGLALLMDEPAPEEVTAVVGQVLSDPGHTAGAQRLSKETAAILSAAEVAEHLIA